MGNISTTVSKKDLTKIPIALYKGDDGDEHEGPITQEQSVGHNVIFNCRTVPSQAKNFVKDKQETSKRCVYKRKSLSLEDKYNFEEWLHYDCPELKGTPYERGYLEGFTELQSQFLAFLNCPNTSKIALKRMVKESKLNLSILNIGDIQEQGVVINLSHRNLYNITTAIGQLRDLRVLDLSGNNLKQIPSEIGSLQKLKELNLSHNQLESLPDAIGNLAELEELDLKNNFLDTLPHSIGNLSNLKVLTCSENKIKTIPREIALLLKLHTLELEGNFIRWLPAEISNLKMLRRTRFHGNPFIKPSYYDTIAAQNSTSPGPPSLLEATTRVIIRDNQRVIASLPASIKLNFKNAQECIFCHGSFIEHKVCKIRGIQRNEHTIPIMYEMCTAHWTSEPGRLKAMFQFDPISTPTRIQNLRRSSSIDSMVGLTSKLRLGNPNRRRIGKTKLVPICQFLNADRVSTGGRSRLSTEVSTFN